MHIFACTKRCFRIIYNGILQSWFKTCLVGKSKKNRRNTELLKIPKVITLLTFVLTLTVTDTTQTPSQTTRLTLQLPSQSVHTSFRTHQSYHCFYPDQ